MIRVSRSDAPPCDAISSRGGRWRCIVVLLLLALASQSCQILQNEFWSY